MTNGNGVDIRRQLSVKDIDSPLVQRAAELGYIEGGWGLGDHMREEIERKGWINCCIWGEKGSCKSNRLLKYGYEVYQNWDSVLKSVVYRPRDLARILIDAKKTGERVPFVAYDDINAFLPRSMYFTDRLLWKEMGRNWDLSRAMINIFMSSCPDKSDVVSFILKDLTHDILTSNRKWLEVRRWIKDVDYYHPMKTLKYSIQITKAKFDYREVPEDIWNRYWENKIALTSESMGTFATTLEYLDKSKLDAVKPKPTSEDIFRDDLAGTGV